MPRRALHIFCSTRSHEHRDPPYFPTRRSSDLAFRCRIEIEGKPAVEIKDTYAGLSYAGGRAPGTLYSQVAGADRKSTRLNSSHVAISYAVFCLKKKFWLARDILSADDLPRVSF